MIPALAGILLAAAALLGSVLPESPRLPGRILIIGGRTLSEGARVTEALDAMVAASGVVGSSRFVLLPGASVLDDDLVASLEGRNDLRAIVAITGDLSLMRGIDPSIDIPDDQRMLTSRRIDEAQLTAAMDRLEAFASRSGTHLVFATAPLGRQGRVETPELLRVAVLVRKRSPLLDLASAFRQVEATPLFVNGIDVLDGFGQEQLARVIFHEICRDDALLPALTDEESGARATQRALDAWMAADETGFQDAVPDAIGYSPTTTLGAVRQVALHTALDGLDATCQRWMSIDQAEGECMPPGWAMARLLCARSRGVPSSCDPLEAELLAIAGSILRGTPFDAWRSGRDLLSLYPHRAEAWVTEQIAATAAGRESATADDGSLARQQAVGWTPVAASRLTAAMQKGAAAAMSLPVMLVAGAPYATLTPMGAPLARFRREFQLGMRESAINIWQRDTRQVLVPPAWLAEVERLMATAQD